MTITFPILLKYKKQYQMCMDFLERHNIVWGDGSRATQIISKHFPVYIIYENGRIYRLFTHYDCIDADFVEAVSCCDGGRPVIMEFEDE